MIRGFVEQDDATFHFRRESSEEIVAVLDCSLHVPLENSRDDEDVLVVGKKISAVKIERAPSRASAAAKKSSDVRSDLFISGAFRPQLA